MDYKVEKELIEKAKTNPKYFEGLYNDNFQRIFLFIFKKIGEKEIASDLASQVFLSALTNLKKYKHMGVPFSSWLYKIAGNEINSYYRKTAKQRQVVLTDQVIEQLRDETGMQVEDMFIKLSKGLQMLKYEALQLIELRFFDNLSFREIATILEVTENNAKVRTYRVLDQLKKNMENVKI